MRIGIVGINHKLANLKLRELLAKACQRRFSAGYSAHDQRAFVLLSTCNRTEIYFSSEDLAETHIYILNILRMEVEEEFDQKLYSYFGHDCFYHLSCVTAGLDSAILAETEIQGQVKAAYMLAKDHSVLPGDLHYLFQKALQVGKLVRSKLPLERGVPRLQDAVFAIGSRIFDSPRDANTLFIGASDINQTILSSLKAKGMKRLSLCNRSLEHAQTVAEQYGIDLLPWQEIGQWQSFDWIICGTKSSEYLVSKEQIANDSCGRKLIIDLCVPRNIDPQVGHFPHIHLYNIDEINHTLQVGRSKMVDLVAQAETIISNAINTNISAYKRREQRHNPLIAFSA